MNRVSSAFSGSGGSLLRLGMTKKKPGALDYFSPGHTTVVVLGQLGVDATLVYDQRISCQTETQECCYKTHSNIQREIVWTIL